MKYTIRFLCLLCVGVVAVSVAFVRWDNAPPGHEPTDLIGAGFRGEAPDDYGGLGANVFVGDEVQATLFVVRGSLHSLHYWDEMCGARQTGRSLRIVEVDYSMNEVRNAYEKAAACLYGGWSRKYDFTVQMVLTYPEEYTDSLPPDLVAPPEAYPPSVAQAEEPGYHVYVRLSGKDAALIWEKLKTEFGDIIQPWNQSAQSKLSILGPNSELAIGWADELDPLVPIDLKSKQYLINERLYAEGKGEAP